MSVEASRRINGPWVVEVDFPDRFSEAIVPESPDEIIDSIQVLTPPTPTYGAVSDMPPGLIVMGAGTLRPIKLPVFEWTGYATSPFSVLPLKNERYFALENKFQGTEYRTPRVAIGKIALLDDIVACSLPVKERHLSKPQVKEAVFRSQPTVEGSIARAIFHILNGQREYEGSYREHKRIYHFAKHAQKAASITKLRKMRLQDNNGEL